MKATATLESSPPFKHAIIGICGRKRIILNGGRSKVAVVEVSKEQQQSPSFIDGDYESLPEVPLFYPIERTSTVVECRDPGLIADRILVCLQKLSIIAKFNSREASAFAEALDFTKFYIRLYKNSTTNHAGILVEMQRVEGDSFNFIKYVQAILAAARGEALFDERSATGRWRSSLGYIPSSVLSCRTLHQEKKQGEKDCEYLLAVEELLTKDRSDAVLLGIDSLLVLTDNMRSNVSSCAAKAVLFGTHPVIKEFIHKCIHHPQTVLSPEDIAFDFDSRQCEIIHTTALAILGNSLQSAYDDTKCINVLDSLAFSEEWIGRNNGIVDVLIHELSQAEVQSHNAYHAARCMGILLDSQNMRSVLIDRGLHHVMKASHLVGHRRHSLLERECHAALALMTDA